MGMDYPEHCFECKLRYNGIHDFCIIGERKFDDEDFKDMDRNDWHPDWCPLRPLPEKHGRLIDADALLGHMKKIHDKWKMEEHYTPTTADEIMTMNMPTISGVKAGRGYREWEPGDKFGLLTVLKKGERTGYVLCQC